LSLLLDALKEAQKQRQSDEAAVQAKSESIDDNAENELEFELELDLESTTLSDPAGDESKPAAETSLASANDSGSTDKVSSEPALQISAPLQQEQVPTPALNKTNIDSPHSANAVFRNRGRLKTKRYLLMGLVVTCLSLLAVGAYLFFLPESFSPPPQAQLRTPNSNQPAEALTSTALVNSPGKSTSSTEKPVTEPPVPSAVPNVVVTQNVESVQGEGKVSTVTSQGTEALAKKDTLEAESPRQSPVDTRDAKNTVEKSVESFSAEESFTGIKIRKRRIPAKREISLRRAQLAMASGDLVGAESNYGSVLETSPTNVVALLGMANLSAIKGQLDQAQMFYQRVLVQSPQNINARAGLLSLASSTSLDVGSALQQLLRESPEKAFLHAGLGDYYLKRSEWPAAQRAYFDAFSRDPKNANYAYNLAISLDQMAKPKLALQFYQQALSLEKSKPAHFDGSVLVARIAVLKAAQR